MDDINYFKQFIKSEFFYQNLKYEFRFYKKFRLSDQHPNKLV